LGDAWPRKSPHCSTGRRPSPCSARGSRARPRWALAIAEGRPAVYLDLESSADRARPALYFADHAEKLVVLDEIHRAPGLFEVLRGVIDRGRREGRGTGRFLLLGSAAIDLLAQSGESLAGRIAFIELAPFDITEVGEAELDRLWVRGGFPDSFLAANDAISLRWRQDFIRTYLEREIPQLGPRIPAETLRRLWTMFAHHQGGLLNGTQLARGLGVSGTTIAHYLDLMVGLLLVRRLAPRLSNAGKRLVRSPKVYLRDSGLVHALLGSPIRRHCSGTPSQDRAGRAWRSRIYSQPPKRTTITHKAISTAQATAPRSTSCSPGQTARSGRSRSSAVSLPHQSEAFHSALADLEPHRALVAYPGADHYRLKPPIEAIPLGELCAQAQARSQGA
jgi:hypothetical protein